MQKLTLDVVVTRGAVVESHHRVHAAVADASGTIVAAAGQPGRVTHWRSCAKPFQVMPLIDAGGFDRIGWGDDQLALAVASHGGEPEHVALAESMLTSIGMEVGDLACGPHDPLAQRGQKLLRDRGAHPSRLHNNCSGKHAAMLATCRARGWVTEGYRLAGHPLQDEILAEVSEAAGATPETAVDGCGVVCFALPLEQVALIFSRLEEREGGAQVVAAMRAQPQIVGGAGQPDTELMRTLPGWAAKGGAEGLFCAAGPDGLGVAVKSQDGAFRAIRPALAAFFGSLGHELGDAFAHVPVRNSRGEDVGELFVATR
jgi:L-asparaginase II